MKRLPIILLTIAVISCSIPTHPSNKCQELPDNIAPNMAIAEGIYKSEGVFTITTIHSYGANTPLVNAGHEIQTDKKINSKKNYIYHIEYVQMLNGNDEWQIKDLICTKN